MYVINNEPGSLYIIWTFPKSGCSTVRNIHMHLSHPTLWDETNFQDKYHGCQRRDKFPCEYVQNYRSYLQILIYRDPYERIVSMFFQKICGVQGVTYNNQNYIEPIRLSRELRTFRDFVNQLILGSFSNDEHFIPQRIPTHITINKIMPIEDVYTIFDDIPGYEHLQKRVKLMGNKDLNVLTKIDNFNEDLVDYDFFIDDLKMLEGNKRPVSSCFLTEEIKTLIDSNYDDDFLRSKCQKRKFVLFKK